MDEKFCARCGRRMTPRKQWAETWDSVRYCSKVCRTLRLRPIDHALEKAMLELLNQRGRGKSLCPSEVARSVGGEGWRDLMESSRMAARRLVAREVAVVTQGNQPVDCSTAKGPIRVALTER